MVPVKALEWQLLRELKMLAQGGLLTTEPGVLISPWLLPLRTAFFIAVLLARASWAAVNSFVRASGSTGSPGFDVEGVG